MYVAFLSKVSCFWHGNIIRTWSAKPFFSLIAEAELRAKMFFCERSACRVFDNLWRINFFF